MYSFAASLNGGWVGIQGKEDIRRMERTLIVNFPVRRQNKRLKSHQCTLIRETRRDRQMECTQRFLETVVFYKRILPQYRVVHTKSPLHPSYILLALYAYPSSIKGSRKRIHLLWHAFIIAPPPLPVIVNNVFFIADPGLRPTFVFSQ